MIKIIKWLLRGFSSDHQSYVLKGKSDRNYWWFRLRLDCDWSEVDILKLAAEVESNTIHPIGKAIVATARAVNAPTVKDKARKATGMQVDVMEDGYTDHDLFSLSSIKGKRDLVTVEDTENEEEINKVVDSDDE